MSDLREKRVDLILQQLEDLPTLPAVALRVLEITGNSDSSAKDVVKLIESDPSLTTRILQLVHRADVGVRGDVNSVSRAVVLLGFESIRSAVLAVSVFQAFSKNDTTKPGEFSREEFWKHCVAVACCCELIAAAVGKKPGETEPLEPSEAFVCGLLHDLGKVALDAMLPKSFSRVVEAADLLRGDIADIERTIVGLDHMVVGKRLAEKWQLPATIRDCIWLHSQMPEALPATVRNARMVNLVTLADQIVREQHLGYSGNFSFPIPRQVLLNAIGLDAKQLNEIIPQLVGHIEPRAKALGLGQASTAELYQQALSQANKELGRVSDQLASRNRKLTIRARFFEALSSFQAELRPDAPPQTVLHAIGQTAVAVLDVTSAAVFSLPPGRGYAEAILVDGSGDVFENTLVDVADQPPLAASQINTTASATPQAAGNPKRAPGDGPVQPVGASLEWFLSAVSPRLGHQNRFWICLEADGQCIGGVMWGAPQGEAQRLSTQVQELTALAGGWSLALRTTQIREEARTLSEQLAETNRQLQSAQSEILRKKTVVTVGEMAAGAAHEMNNPLAVISGRSQLLASTLSDPKQKAMAHLIHEQSHRLSQIITELMDFAKPVPPAIVESDLADLVHRALHEAKAMPEHADRSVEVTFADVPPVAVDVTQVVAALVEVIDNALQATAEMPKSRSKVEIHAAYDSYSSRVVLTVSDNGCGMDETTMKRAFDPFFSSKPAGRRRGMGLAKALRWIEGIGGSIRLESHEKQGTRTVMLLPATNVAASQQSQPKRKQA
ncbi:MAG: HDOD domain-containing protein [Anaerolineae bacterium]|nr:HDOD domain-containing protein [Phycisphaerae bacterium]